MNTPKTNDARIHVRLFKRRPIPKGYGDALNVGWSGFISDCQKAHKEFFERRGMDVPAPENFNCWTNTK